MPEAYASIPSDLTSLPNWVMWHLGERNGKPTKIPFKSDGSSADSTDSESWTKFDNVKHTEPTKTGGIGFVFDGKGIVGIDLDHCLSADGTIDARFSHIVETLKTYTEISPS